MTSGPAIARLALLPIGIPDNRIGDPGAGFTGLRGSSSLVPNSHKSVDLDLDLVFGVWIPRKFDVTSAGFVLCSKQLHTNRAGSRSILSRRASPGTFSNVLSCNLRHENPTPVL